ncbi:membrane protein [Arthrobacter phage EvePickles]|nr:membrane protein [Arthrobacter phage EvePickles]
MKDALKPIAVVLTVLLGIFLISWAGFAINVAMSGPKGQGDAIKQKNSAENWTAQQAKFERLYAGIQSADEKTELANARLASNPKDLTLQQTAAGVQSGCISLVSEYNSKSREFLAEDFKAADLPHEIDRTDPAFDCK